MQAPWKLILLAIFLLTVMGQCPEYGQAQTPQGSCAAPGVLIQPLQGEVFTEGKPPQLPLGQPCAYDRQLPINLATALRLADGRPLVIAAAQASLRVALARLAAAEVLWLPTIYLGGSYYRHDGAAQGNSGDEFINGRNQYMFGAGPVAVFSATDAIFVPLAAQQVVKARESDVQSARNDALLSVAEAYFNVQQARGQHAGALDAGVKARQLLTTVESLAKDLVPPIEADRVRTELADLEQAEALARADWRVASADLTRLLRLHPAAVVAPMEPPFIQVTLISTREAVDDLIPIGLLSRPELASQKALVEAALIRIRQERLRPLVPIVALEGDAAPAAPGGFLMGGAFGSSTNQGGNPWSARNDVSIQLLWELRNMGFGNHALVKERQAEQEQALIELDRIQDRVAAEIVQAYSLVQQAEIRVAREELAVKEAQKTYAGNLKGLSQTTRFGDMLVLVNRPQEVVAALQMLFRAYNTYFQCVNDYNRAQFRLYRALGYPAGILACERFPGALQPVDTTRPPQLTPIIGPAPSGPGGQ
jgi:outer membrane protein TolC